MHTIAQALLMIGSPVSAPVVGLGPEFTLNLSDIGASNTSANPPNGTIVTLASDTIPGITLTNATLYNNSFSPGPTDPTRPYSLGNRRPNGTKAPFVGVALKPDTFGVYRQRVIKITWDWASAQAVIDLIAISVNPAARQRIISNGPTPPNWEWATNTFTFLEPLEYVGFEFEPIVEGGFLPSIRIANFTIELVTIP